jgi:hypothetical protein
MVGAPFFCGEAMRKELFKKIKTDLAKMTLTELSARIGIQIPTLCRIVNGKSRGDIESWEKIAGYYGGEAVRETVSEMKGNS